MISARWAEVIARAGKRSKMTNGWKTNSRFPVKVLAAVVMLLCVAVILCAQETGISAGGRWMEYDSQNQMTLVKSARFELDADNSLPGSEANPKVILFCTGGKLTLGDFRPNAMIAPPNRPGFWGQPQMEVTVRVDNSHSNHGWNWVNGHFLSMDKGTVREMLGAQVFKVEVATPRGPRDRELFSRRPRPGSGEESL